MTMLELSKLCKTAAICAAGLLVVAAGISAREPQKVVHMSRTTNTTSVNGPIRQCSDLEVSFESGARVARAEDKLTIPRSSAPVLRAHLTGPSGISVYTGSGGDYSVTVCKYAAATYASSSNENLDAIKVTAQDGEIQASVPDDNNWLLYLIVHAPAGVAFDLSTRNGQMDLFDLSGRITARVENGPLTLEHCTGEVDASTANGPMTVKGSSGNMHLRTENGPLDIKLEGNKWENGEVEGSTQNGPLTLGVGAGYLSGVVVRTDGHSPVSCRAAACDGARRTWDDRSRNIEIGKQPIVIRLSTYNGPVSVESRTSSSEDN